MRHIARRLAGGLLLAAGPLAGQAIPKLGSEALLGTGGITALAPQGGLDGLSNPALLAVDRGWGATLGFVHAAAIDVNERTAAARWSSARVGVGLRVASRAVDNLFEDPGLGAAGLEVRDAEAGAGFGVRLRGIAAGLAATWFGSTVLGSRGSGVAVRFGLAGGRGRWMGGLSYGQETAPMTWRPDGGSTFRSPGVSRLAVALAYGSPASTRVPLRTAVEFDRESGRAQASWVRATLGLGLFRDHLRCFAGSAVEVSSQQAPGVHEVGLTVGRAGIALSLGYRFAAGQVPGNALALDASLGLR